MQLVTNSAQECLLRILAQTRAASAQRRPQYQPISLTSASRAVSGKHLGSPPALFGPGSGVRHPELTHQRSQAAWWVVGSFQIRRTWRCWNLFPLGLIF